MVNVGGPSKGCRTCIQRKIRCDRQRPVCGQCTKSKRHCRGYRDAVETMFRDQTKNVTVTNWEGRKTTPLGQSSSSSDAETANRTDLSSPDMLTLTRSPKLGEEDGLIAFFANNFTCNNFRPGTNLFWVPPNFEDLLKHKSMELSVQSAGAMALARLQKSSYYEREAQKHYGLALLTLAEESRLEPELEQDSVLFTILFLSFFEILASYDSSSRQSWLTHLSGLGVLLGKKTERYLRSGVGARMLLQSRSQAIFDALRNKTQVAEVYRKQLPPNPFAVPPAVFQTQKADTLLIRLATLQSHRQTLGPSQTVLAELMALDGEFCQWIADLPQSWAFSEQSNNYYSGRWWDARCDVYSAPVIAHIWNKVRAGRILTLDLIRETSLHLSLLEADDLSSSALHISEEFTTLEIRCLTTDICATIPSYYRPSTTVEGPHKAGIPPLLGTTYWLLWPLEVLGCMREASPELTTWLIQCFERIHTTTGIAKAQVAADMIRAKRRSADLIGAGDIGLLRPL